MANQDLFFDITKEGVEQEKQQYIISRVGDGGLKAITITVHSNGRPYNLTGLTPVFEGVKPDGEKIIDTTGAIVLDPRNGVFRYVFPQQASTAEGKYEQAFFKLKRGEQTDSTLEVQVTVLKNKVEFGINSESYFTEYQKELERLKLVVEDGIEKLKEKSANTAEKINTQVETAKALNIQLEAIKSAVGSNELVTKLEYQKMVEGVQEQVSTFISSIENVRQSIELKVDEFERKKLNAGVVAGVLDNPANITKSGFYYFDGTTEGLPTRNTGHSNGYIQALMKDRDNGMLVMMGTGFAIEKYKGSLFDRWVTSIPVELWTGKAKKGDIIELRGNVHQFGELRIKVGFYTNRNAIETTRIPENGEGLYLNHAGLQGSENNYKNGHLEEIEIFVKDDTHLQITKALIATGDAVAVDSDAYISAVYGLY